MTTEKLISEIKQNIQDDNVEALKVLLEDLKEKANLFNTQTMS